MFANKNPDFLINRTHTTVLLNHLHRSLLRYDPGGFFHVVATFCDLCDPKLKITTFSWYHPKRNELVFVQRYIPIGGR